MRLLSEIHTNISTQGPQILTFPSELPLSELGFDNYIEQSHCQPFLKTPSASNWCQFAAEVWDEAENALERLPAEPPSGGDAGILSISQILPLSQPPHRRVFLPSGGAAAMNDGGRIIRPRTPALTSKPRCLVLASVSRSDTAARSSPRKCARLRGWR